MQRKSKERNKPENYLLCSFFGVIPWILVFCADVSEHFVGTIKFRRQGIAQKEEYNMHNTA
jgi:hypothetical protein